MKWREFLFMVGGVLLGGLAMVIFFRQGNSKMPADGQEVAQVEEATANAAFEPKPADDRQINEPIYETQIEAAPRAGLIIDEYFDPERLIN